MLRLLSLIARWKFHEEGFDTGTGWGWVVEIMSAQVFALNLFRARDDEFVWGSGQIHDVVAQG